MGNSGVRFVNKGEERVIQLIQGCNKQRAMVLQLGRCPEGMVPLVHAFKKPTLSCQGSACGQGTGLSSPPVPAALDISVHYLLLSPREGSFVPAGNLPEKTGM